MSNIKVIFQKLPASELEFQQKLKNISETEDETPNVLYELQQFKMKKTGIGPRHFAFLTDDGQICRVGFSASSAVLSTKPRLVEKEAEGVPKEGSTKPTSSSYPMHSDLDLQIAFASRSNRGRLHRPYHARRPPGLGRPVDDSLQVPEDHIKRCEDVLPGTPRDTIRKELQLTHLDVNMAINNILTRDEDPPTGAPVSPAYLPHISGPEDLMSIIGEQRAGADGDLFEFMMGRPRPFFNQRLERFTSAQSEPPPKMSRQATREPSTSADVQYQDAEWWPFNKEDSESYEFVQIVALHEELIALDSKGRLHQWNWHDAEPFQVEEDGKVLYHPKTMELGLASEEVTQLAGSVCRASVITKSNKIAILADTIIHPFEHLVEQPATHYPELGDLSGALLYTCSQWTLIVVKNEAYWMGVAPFELRRRQLEAISRQAGRKLESLAVGSVVSLKKQPAFRARTRAIKLLDNQPRVGELVHDLVTLDTTCKNTSKCKRFCRCKNEVDFKILQPYELLVENFDPPKDQNERKRKFEEMETSEHQKWDIRHCVFLPNDQRTEVVGTIKRMQDNVCIVSYGNADKINDPNIKIFRKDELCLANSTSRSLDTLIRTPKKLSVGPHQKIIAAQIDEESTVHLITKNLTTEKIQYAKFDLGMNEFISAPTTLRATQECFIRDGGAAVQIDHTFGDVPCILVDGARVHQPIFFNDGTLQDPEWYWLGLPRINALSSSIYNMSDVTEAAKPDRAFVALVCLERQILSPILIKNVPELVKALLSVIQENQTWQPLTPRLVGEIVDGERNLLHICIDSNAPAKDKKATDMKYTKPKKVISKCLDDMMESVSVMCSPGLAQELKLKVTQKLENSSRCSVICAPFSAQMILSDEGTNWQVSKDSCLNVLLGHPVIAPYTSELLKAKDAFGRTPFMYAIFRRAYKQAAAISEKILGLVSSELEGTDPTAEESHNAFKKYIFPENSPRDFNPLYVLCCNDTCSFTWTKKQHIKQDIYECKTCNLTESLCCCTECAQTCHVGHECVLKKTSPTAYCDCSNSCQCKSLTEGDQEERERLLHYMLRHTQLVQCSTNKGEHLVQFLAQTVARQIKEQANLSEVEQTVSRRSKDLPPTFCRKALRYCLADWTAVQGLILCKRDNLCASFYSAKCAADDKQQLESQKGVARLDKFVQTILLRLHSNQWDYMGTLLETLTNQRKLSKGKIDEPTVLAGIHRFVRAVIRVFVCFAGNLQPSTMTNEKQRKCLERFGKVFKQLNDVAVEELCMTSEALLAPVRLGAVRPVPAFEFAPTASEAVAGTDDLFRVDPCAPKRQKSESSRPHRSTNPLDTRTSNFVAGVRAAQGESAWPARGGIGRQIRSFTDRLDRQRAMQSESDAWNVLEELELAPETDHSDNEEDVDMEDEMQDQDDDDDEDDDRPPLIEINDHVRDIIDADDTDVGAEGDLELGMFQGGYPDNEDGTEDEASDHDDRDEGDEDDIDPEEDDDDETVWNRTFDVMRPRRESTPQDDDSFMMFPELDEVERALRNTRRREQDRASSNLWWAVRPNRTRLAEREVGDRVQGFGTMNMPDPSKRPTTSSTCQTSESQSKLARCAALCIKEVAALLQPDLSRPSNDLDMLLRNVQRLLQPCWEWLMATMDWTESQLRYGATLHRTSEPRKEPRFRHESDGSRDKKNTRQVAAHEFMSYALSLMRQQNSEHSDMMPSLDVGALRHVAYILDAFISLLKAERSLTSAPKTLADSHPTVENPNHIFFRRSDSMLFLGGADDDPFDAPFHKALPLADKPHLLRPKSTKEELFGRGCRGEGKQAPQSSTSRLPEHMSLTRRVDDNELKYLGDEQLEPDALLSRWRSCVELFARVFMDDVGSEEDSVLRQLASFNLRQSKFQKQMDDLIKGAKNTELALVVNRQREKLIPQTVKQLNEEFTNKSKPDAKARSNAILGWGIPSSSRAAGRNDGLMVSKKIKVRFEGEPGEGNGVMRSFFTTIADALLENQPVPKMDVPNASTGSSKTDYINRRSGLSGLQRYHQRTRDKSSLNINAEPWSPDKSKADEAKHDLKAQLYDKIKAVNKQNAAKLTGMFLQSSASNRLLMTNDEELCRIRVTEALRMLKDHGLYEDEKTVKTSDPDDAALFCLPSSTQRYYCPNPGRATEQRLNIFRNVGRILGLALLHNELCPLPLTRPIVKQILGRRVNWPDLAFYDSTIFESLRKLVLSAKEDPESVADYELTFAVDDEDCDGKVSSVELIPDGAGVGVTHHNVYAYVRKYAQYKMVTKWEKAVKQLRKGVFDVVSEQSLNGLTPEDWWLLVNGVGTVDVAKLTQITTFNDESNAKDENDKSDVNKLQKWLWEVVESFTQQERQELLYFWTGAPALRAGEEAFEPAPSVTIRGPNDQSLPSANTCISRLYLPLYSSKAILKTKLSMAIKTKTFGFV